ncbi:MAG: SAVED domain-containing protein [Firmicutes bacterium]|nr:SAVED domain-containing protein [Bacillota bacterium]
MSVSHIPEKVKIRLWGKAAGRCQYDGCNKPLWLDSLTNVEFNTAYVAHIIADQPDGPRGDLVLSETLKADISNLMLMCDEHHRLIDRENVDGHTVERLRQMKRKHEERIEIQTSVKEDKQSQIVLYGANIGQHFAHVSWEKAALAMYPGWYPAQKQAIELSLKNSLTHDYESLYWTMERENLRRQFNQAILPRLSAGHVEHFSVFALAPQPLLIELGRLLSDIPAAEVYQLHREPPNWLWQEHPVGFNYILHEPDTIKKTVALNLSLSASVNNSRITSVLGNDTSIWILTIENPNNDFLKSREQLSEFRQKFRLLLDRIKSVHEQDVILHLFPAAPVSIAVEVGRVWMPKADLPIRIYDQNYQDGGFLPIFDISNVERGEWKDGK